jgi:hypothetical protein
MLKATTTIDTFCFTGELLEFKLEESFLITTLLSNPEDKSVVKDVAQNFKKFYFRDTSNSAAVFSSGTDVRNNFLFCSHSIKFCMSVQLGSVLVREKLSSTVLDSRILGEYLNTFAAIVDRSRFNNSCLRLLKISDDNNE